MTSVLIDKSAVELAESMASGTLTSVDVVSAHLDRIDAVNPAVNAIVAMFDREQILAEAEARDEFGPVGPLHGLPVAVKDLEDVAGLPTRAGSTVTTDRPATEDGYVAARLRRAGAVIVGKTNTPEFGTGSHTFNEVYGVTRNPWDLERSAGGSSGGAAAALAARMLPIADGSDLGGSLRNPAAFCGVVGLRPSLGRVARPVDTSTHLVRLSVQGPMGRTVGDTALLLSALAGPDPRDPLALPDDPGLFADPLPTTTTARLAWGGDLGAFRCDPEVLAVAHEAARHIEGAGGTYADDHPDLGEAMRVFRVLRGLSYRNRGADLGPELLARTKATIRENVAFGRSLSVDDVLDAERSRARLHLEMAGFFGRFDVLALPTTQVAAFPVEVEYPTEIAGEPMADYLEWMTSCCVVTATGCPAISIPAGFTSTGLPVGLQLLAPVGHDRRLLEVAAALEHALGSTARRDPPPLTV